MPIHRAPGKLWVALIVTLDIASARRAFQAFMFVRPASPVTKMGDPRTRDRSPPFGELRYTGRGMSPDDFEARFDSIRQEMAKVVVGQEEIVDGVLVALLAKGHVLIEGAPGLGKTLVARALGVVSGTSFKRIQFTPDLMPSDVTGSSVFDRQTSAFTFIAGPIFCQLLLADEINRAPAKTQSALLEAMQDRQVTVDGTSRPLPAPFSVIATQNPVESQGTYPLPEAQLDRFLVKLLVNDPPRDVEHTIVRHHAGGFDPTDLSSLRGVVTPTLIGEMQAAAQAVRVDDSIVGYIVDLVRRTRDDRAIELGASPRASIALLKCAQVIAASAGRAFVTPDDVKPMTLAVLRHRIMLHPDAQLQGVTADDRIHEILKSAPVPAVAA
jgi:MoxR-like ATPase